MRSESIIINIVLISVVNAFVSRRHVPSSRQPSRFSLSMISSFFPPNPPSSAVDASPRPPNRPPPFSLEPEVIFGRCKAILATDLCIREPSLLSPDFIYVGPYIETLNKEEYIAAGKFFDLRRTFPDLDYRAHDFRIVDTDGNDSKSDIVTVRCTLRTVGTMRGELRLRNEVLPPNGKKMVCPPEALTIKLDANSGLVVQLCSGFVMDRLVGNTGGLCGIMAAATIAGAPPSEWDVYPPTVVISRFFARTVKQLPLEPSSFLAPFPETVMVQLAKGVLACDYGSQDTTLLSKDFSFCDPIIGPMGKDTFLNMMAQRNMKEIFPNLSEQFSNFRVDPYDPYRVWVDLKAQGMTKEGTRFDGPPEAVSLTFDDNGFCTRLTAGAVIDPTVGNTDGLGGILGMQYSLGQTSPLNTRPLSQLFSRTPRYVARPFQGNDNKGKEALPTLSKDTKAIESSTQKISSSPSNVPSIPFSPSKDKVESVSTAKISPVPMISKPTPSKAVPKQISKTVAPKRMDNTKPKSLKIPESKPVTSKATTGSSIITPSQKSTKNIVTKQLTMVNTPNKLTPVSIPNKKETKINNTSEKDTIKVPISKKSKETEVGRIQSQPKILLGLTSEKDTIKVPPTSKKSKETEVSRIQSQPRILLGLTSEKAMIKIPTNKKSKETEVSRIQSQPRILLGLIKKQAKEEKGFTTGLKGTANVSAKNTPSPSLTVKAGSNVPPKGVPMLKGWKKSGDGSISGSIYGSKAFFDGDAVTTSAIASGIIEKGNVVITTSGSKYYLG